MQLHAGQLFNTIYRDGPSNYTSKYSTLFNAIHVDDDPSRLGPAGSMHHTSSHPEETSTGESSSLGYITVEIHYVLLLVIMVSSVAINGLIFLLFYRRPSVRLTSNKFVLNMAVVHLLQTFLIMPFVFVSVMFQGWIFGDVLCQIHGAASVCLTMASVLSILLIAVDRNCAVNSPLHYSMTITKKRTSGLIVSAWLFAILVSVPPLTKLSKIEYQDSWAMCTVAWYEPDLLTIAYSCVLFVVGFLLPFVRITWIYASMFRAARRNSARARLHNINTSAAEMNAPPVPDGGQQPCTMYIHRRMAWSKRTSSLGQASSLFGDEWKAVRTGLLVVISFTACFLPFFSMILLEPQTRSRKAVLQKLPAISMLFVFCSSLIGPYLYVIRNKATRKHVRKIFTCLRRKPSIFSPKGYHYSHQSPPQDRRCSEGNMVDPESSMSIRSAASADYQRALVTQSLYQNKTGNWKFVTVTAHPGNSSTRRSSVAGNIILRPSTRGEEVAQHPYYQQRVATNLRAAAIRNGFYRRASLDSSKILSARFPAGTVEREPDASSVRSSIVDRSMSFRLRGRFANRDDSMESCDTSCDSTYSQEDWGHFLEQSFRRGRRDSHCSVSTLVCNEAPSVAPIHQHRTAAPTASSPNYYPRPVLRRGRSFAFDEQELASCLASPKISQYGGLRKSHFVNAKSYPRHSSSETTTTTLGSSTSTESQDASAVTSPPRSLAPSSPPSFCQYHHCAQHHVHQQIISSQGSQERRDSGFEDAMLDKCDMCYTIVDETGSIKAVKFLEQ